MKMSQKIVFRHCKRGEAIHNIDFAGLFWAISPRKDVLMLNFEAFSLLFNIFL